MSDLAIIIATIFGFVVSALVVLGVSEYRRFMQERKRYWEEYCKRQDARLTPHQINLNVSDSSVTRSGVTTNKSQKPID